MAKHPVKFTPAPVVDSDDEDCRDALTNTMHADIVGAEGAEYFQQLIASGFCPENMNSLVQRKLIFFKKSKKSARAAQRRENGRDRRQKKLETAQRAAAKAKAKVKASGNAVGVVGLLIGDCVATPLVACLHVLVAVCVCIHIALIWRLSFIYNQPPVGYA